MASTKHQTLTAELTEADLFAALTYAVQQAKHGKKQKTKYSIEGLSHEIKEMYFTSAKTPMSWGHVFVANVVPEGTGSVLQLTASVMPNTPTSLMDGRKNQKMLDALVAEVEAVLALPEVPQPEPVESFETMEDGSTRPWTTRDLTIDE